MTITLTDFKTFELILFTCLKNYNTIKHDRHINIANYVVTITSKEPVKLGNLISTNERTTKIDFVNSLQLITFCIIIPEER